MPLIGFTITDSYLGLEILRPSSLDLLEGIECGKDTKSPGP